MSRTARALFRSTAISIILAAHVSAASAQAPASDAEIVVTAQRRSEALENVPLSVTAVPAARMERLNLRDLQSLQEVTPGLTFNTGINYAQTVVRGIGGTLTNPGLEPAVATYIDGAYLERGFGAIYDVLDPQSVQVLRGPQGTLWGRNATGGAIIVTTADPQPAFGARATGEVGSLDHRLAEGVLNAPLGDRAALRLAARYREDGGYIRNLVDGFEFGSLENWTVRGKIAVDLTSALSAVFQAQYDESTRSPGANAQFLPPVYCAFCAASAYPYPRPDPYTTVGNVFNGGEGGHDESAFFNLRVNYDVGNWSLRSTTALRDTDNFEAGDFDYTEITGFNIMQKSGAKTFTQDIEASTSSDGLVNAVAGLSYLDDESYYQLDFPPDTRVPTTPAPISNVVSTESVSGFAELVVSPAAGLTITGGLRYTRDERNIRATNVSFESTTPRLVVAYDTGPLNFYVSYNKGFKSGGLDVISSNTFFPEEIASYEAGVKYLSSDRRLRTSLSAFSYDYSDIQTLAIDQSNPSNLTSTLNADGEGAGVELEFEFAPADFVQLFGGASYLDAQYTRFPNAGVQVPTFNSAGQPTGIVAGVEDLSGHRLAHAPEWTAFLGATASTAVAAGWRGELTGFVRYSSSYDFHPGAGGPLRADVQPAYATARISGRVMPESERYEIGFYIDNVFDELYYDFRFTAAPFGAQQIVARPRTYGLRVRAAF